MSTKKLEYQEKKDKLDSLPITHLRNVIKLYNREFKKVIDVRIEDKNITAIKDKDGLCVPVIKGNKKLVRELLLIKDFEDMDRTHLTYHIMFSMPQDFIDWTR